MPRQRCPSMRAHRGPAIGGSDSRGRPVREGEDVVPSCCADATFYRFLTLLPDLLRNPGKFRRWRCCDRRRCAAPTKARAAVACVMRRDRCLVPGRRGQMLNLCRVCLMARCHASGRGNEVPRMHGARVQRRRLRQNNGGPRGQHSRTHAAPSRSTHHGFNSTPIVPGCQEVRFQPPDQHIECHDPQ